MTRTGLLVGLCFAALAMPRPAPAQHAGAVVGVPRLIVVRLVQRSETPMFAFEPATFTAERGDTLEFVQFAETMHNVHFTTVPKGASLGRAAISRYLTTKGQTYAIVVDGRFVEGKYEIVCDPHSMMGMHAFLTVAGDANSRAAGK